VGQAFLSTTATEKKGMRRKGAPPKGKNKFRDENRGVAPLFLFPKKRMLLRIRGNGEMISVKRQGGGSTFYGPQATRKLLRDSCAFA